MRQFIFVAFLFFASLAIAAMRDLFEGQAPERVLAAFVLVMAVWAAGLLLLPANNF